MTRKTDTDTESPSTTDTSSVICGALLSPYEPFDSGFAAVPGRAGRSATWIVCNRAAGHSDEIVLPEPDPAVAAARAAAAAQARAAGFTIDDTEAEAEPLDQAEYHQAVDLAGNVLARCTEEDRQAILRFAHGLGEFTPEPV